MGGNQELAMDASNVVSLGVLGYVVGLLSVGVIALLVGIRLGAKSTIAAPPSEQEQLVQALRILRRHYEQAALAEMQAAGAQLWSPDVERLAELSYGAKIDAQGDPRP
jgi:hypothetical protein